MASRSAAAAMQTAEITHTTAASTVCAARRLALRSGTAENSARAEVREPVKTTTGRAFERADWRLLEHVRSGFPHGWIERPGLAAVSGGADSLAMLELLADARGGEGMTVAYVDHGTRPEAAFEAAWVAASARRRRAAFVKLDGRGSGRSEAAMRERRYRALGECARHMGAHWIATAHTADDQIETLLLRLLRGSGRRGLGGVAPVRGRLVRPLLGSRRTDLRAFLVRRGIGWCEDPSNRDRSYARNRLRHDVIPAIEEAFGEDCLRRLPELADRWREEDRFLDSEAARFQAFATVGVDSAALDLRALAETPPALQPRVLRAWFARASGGHVLSLAQMTCLEALSRRHHGCEEIFVAGVRLVREYSRLRACRDIRDRPPVFAIPVDLSQPGRLEGPGGTWSVSIRPRPSGEAPPFRSIAYEAIDLDAAAFDHPLELRPLREGDRVPAECGSGHRAVRDMMIDRKVPQGARSDWPVLATPESVVWVPGITLGEAIRPGDRSNRVRLTWRRLKI